MTRVSMIATALVIGLLAGSATSVQAKGKDKKDNKDKGHKFIGLSPVDFPHHGDEHHGDEHHGDKNTTATRIAKTTTAATRITATTRTIAATTTATTGSCHHGTKPPKENMGGSTYHPPGTPGGPPLPKKTWPFKLPPGATKFYGSQTMAGNPMNGLHDPLRHPVPRGSQGQIPTLGTGFNGFAGAIGKDVGSVVGFGVTEGLKGVGSVATAVGDVAGGVVNAVGDVASGVVSGFESLL